MRPSNRVLGPALFVGLVAAGCGASPAPSPRPPPVRRISDPSPEPPRYLYTSPVTAAFDEAGRAPTLPGPEPAVILGARMIVDGGIVVRGARDGERLRGFRSLPARLRGGFLFWSDDRVYWSAEFLGPLEPVVDVTGPSGVRPWIDSILVRSRAGFLAVDPKSLAVRRASMPGVADAMAIDARRAARLDAFGRASYTLDGGAHWTDVLRTQGSRILAIQDSDPNELTLVVERDDDLVLGLSGDLTRHVEPPASAGAETWPSSPFLDHALYPASARVLPNAAVGYAMALGGILPGGRMLLGGPGGVRVLSTRTGLVVAEADPFLPDGRFSDCDALTLGTPPRPFLACSGAASSAVLSFDKSFTRPSLEATFPDPSSFIMGPHDRLAFGGRCGLYPPRATDLGPTLGSHAAPQGETRDPAEDRDDAGPKDQGAVDLPPDDDEHVCLRLRDGSFIERRVEGPDARDLFRWIPGDDGQVTALVVGDGGDEGDGATSVVRSRAKKTDGVRVVRIRANDLALAGATLIPPSMPVTEAPPFRTLDGDFWQDDDGVLRGWARLQDSSPKTDLRKPMATPAGKGDRGAPRNAHRRRTNSQVHGGRLAGVRIDSAGSLTVLPLPEGVVQVVSGDRFGLAMAPSKDGDRWFETVDGGALWTPVEGPPAGRIDPSADEKDAFGCSLAGCVFQGIVRLGWGGPPPAASPAKDPAFGPRAGRLVRETAPVAITCRRDRDDPQAPPTSAAASTKSAHPVALLMAPSNGTATSAHAWTWDVVPPFQPGAALLHVALTDPARKDAIASAVPILGSGRTPVDLVVQVDQHFLRPTPTSAARLPDSLGHSAHVAHQTLMAADAPRGVVMSLDQTRNAIAVVRGDAATPVISFVKVRDAAGTQVTLARRIQDGTLDLVGYSTTSGEVFAGPIDRLRSEIGPTSALANLDTLGEAFTGTCAGIAPTHRMLIESPVKLRIVAKGGTVLTEQVQSTWLLIAANATKLCLEGMEGTVPRSPGSTLTARWAEGRGEAVTRGKGQVERGTCHLEDR